MAVVKEFKGDQDDVHIKVDLDELFDGKFPDNEALKQRVGQAIVDRIIERTEDGLDKNNKGLKAPYSSGYADSLEFKAFGKSKSKVNMTLRGDMLGLLDVTEVGESSVTIGWDDTTQSNKAHNHVNGVTVPKRDFLGLSDSDREAIKQEFRSEIEKINDVVKEPSMFDSLLLSEIAKLAGELGEF